MLVGVGCAWRQPVLFPLKKAAFVHSFWRNRLRIAGVGSWKGGDTTGAKCSALARTSLGSGFWLAAALACLPVAMPSDESPRIRCGAGCAYADCHHSAVVAVFRRA